VRRSFGLLFLLAVIGVFLSLSCGSDCRRCTEPEPDDTPIAYIFKGLEILCEGCGMPRAVYWYFECEAGGCQYGGYWDPLEEPDPPEWFATVAEAERHYDNCGWGCVDSLWASCLDPSETPRENEEAEEASIWLSGSLVAPQQLYERVAADLALIRSGYGDESPRLMTIRFMPCYNSSAIWVQLMPEAAARFRQGEFHDLDSLNTRFNVSDILMYEHSCGLSLSLVFDGRYNTVRLSQIYKDTPSVLTAEPGLADGAGGFEKAQVLPWPLR
jgi:hypothetical protein